MYCIYIQYIGGDVRMRSTVYLLSRSMYYNPGTYYKQVPLYTYVYEANADMY